MRAVIGLFLLLGLTGQALAAVKTLSGVELSAFEGREMLVFRTSGDVAAPSTFKRDKQAGVVRFTLNAEPRVAAEQAKTLQGALIRSVQVDSAAGETQVAVTLTNPELADPACFRFSTPSQHLLVFEVFPAAEQRDQAPPIKDKELDEWLRSATEPAGPAPAAKSRTIPAVQPAGGPPASSRTGASFAGELGIPSLDLSAADAQRVLGLAADLGLLNLRGRADVRSEKLGGVSVKPGGQSLMSWTEKTPPGEIYLAGTPEQIAKFMQYGDPNFIGGQPTLQQEWAQARPQASSKPVMGGRSAATRSRIKDDPAGGLYYSDYQPGGVRLSDILVTLDASNGRNLYDVLNFLSEISGISLVIDPYAFDEPTGSKRELKTPEAPASDGGGSGFRPAGVFQPESGRTGTVRGNFVNVPFDQFLETVLSTHELVYAVQGAGGSSDSGYGGTDRGPGGGTLNADPYQKPVILVTSRQRMEYELSGTNEINLSQFHYADPDQMAQILDQFGLMADVNSGWYVYRGNGNGNGNGGNGGNGNGFGGNNGGGNNGGGFGGNGGNRAGGTAGARPDVYVYRGGSRAPVEQAVADAVAAGKSVVRVQLAAERSGEPLVTLFSQSSKAR